MSNPQKVFVVEGKWVAIGSWAGHQSGLITFEINLSENSFECQMSSKKDHSTGAHGGGVVLHGSHWVKSSNGKGQIFVEPSGLRLQGELTVIHIWDGRRKALAAVGSQGQKRVPIMDLSLV